MTADEYVPSLETLLDHYEELSLTVSRDPEVSKGNRRIAEKSLARARREAKAEAWEEWTSGLATHLDGATPRAWGFHHPCDPPGERWEPSVKDRTIMEVADFLRDREANPNPYHTSEKESRHDD